MKAMLLLATCALALSGVAATLFPFSGDAASLEMSDFRRQPGELIAQAITSEQEPGRRPRRRAPRRRRPG